VHVARFVSLRRAALILNIAEISEVTVWNGKQLCVDCSHKVTMHNGNVYHLLPGDAAELFAGLRNWGGIG